MRKNFLKNKIGNLAKIEKIKFCLFFILLAVLLIILTSQVFTDISQEQKNYVSLTNDALDERMSSLYNEINNLPSGAGNDVLFLSNLVNVKNFVFNDSNIEINNLNQDFAEFLNQNIAYKKVTVIKTDNRSGLSVERQSNGEIIFSSLLNDSPVSKDILNKALKLEKDKVYISDLQKDVLSDSGSLVLYYATSIFDGKETMGGVLILTVDSNYFLNDVRNFSRPGEQVFLINSLGDYLANSDISKEYINGGDKFGFKKDFPEVANEILSISDQRIIKTDKSVFIFRYIQPTLSSFNIYKITDGSNIQEIRDNFYWVLVSVSDRQDINVFLSGIKKQRILFLLIIAMIAVFIGVVVYSMHRGLINKIKAKELKNEGRK